MVRSMERIERNKISGNGIGAGAGNPPAASVPAPGISPAFRIGAGVPGREEVFAPAAAPATPGNSPAIPAASTPAMAAPGANPPDAGNSGATPATSAAMFTPAPAAPAIPATSAAPAAGAIPAPTPATPAISPDAVTAPGISPAPCSPPAVPGTRAGISAPATPAAMFTPAAPAIPVAPAAMFTPAPRIASPVPTPDPCASAPPAPRRSYRVLDEAGCAAAFARLRDGGLLWAFDCEWEEPSLERWMRVCTRPDVLLLEGLVDGVAAGLMKIAPFQERTLCGEVGVAAYRGFFAPAAWLARGACLWCFAHLDCVSLLGRVAVPNRHALRMAPQVGFRELCRVPGMCWYGRKQRFVDGALLLATPESVQACEV